MALWPLAWHGGEKEIKSRGQLVLDWLVNVSQHLWVCPSLLWWMALASFWQIDLECWVFFAHHISCQVSRLSPQDWDEVRGKLFVSMTWLSSATRLNIQKALLCLEPAFMSWKSWFILGRGKSEPTCRLEIKILKLCTKIEYSKWPGLNIYPASLIKCKSSWKEAGGFMTRCRTGERLGEYLWVTSRNSTDYTLVCFCTLKFLLWRFQACKCLWIERYFGLAVFC